MIRRDRHEGVAKAIVEIENVVEIFAAIAVRFFHLTDIDQVENDLAEVAGRCGRPIR